MKWLRKILYYFPLKCMVAGFPTIPYSLTGKWTAVPESNSQFILVHHDRIMAVYGKAIVSMKPISVDINYMNNYIDIKLKHFEIESLPNAWEMPFLLKNLPISKKIQKNGLCINIQPVPNNDTKTYNISWTVPNINKNGTVYLTIKEKHAHPTEEQECK